MNKRQSLILTILTVQTRPGELAFEAARQNPSANNLSTSFFLAGVAAPLWVFLGAIGSLIDRWIGGTEGSLYSFLIQTGLSPQIVLRLIEFLAPVEPDRVGCLTRMSLTALIWPIVLLLISGFYLLIARLFGGIGSFKEQTYLLAIIYIPIAVLNAGLGIIPLLGDCLMLITLAYQLLLTYFALKVCHRLTRGPALVVTIAAPFFLTGCAICAANVVWLMVAAR